MVHHSTKALTKPVAGTVVAPVFQYDDDQATQINKLREVRNILRWSQLSAKPQHQYAYEQLLPESDPYRPWELRWLRKPDTMGRYMRAAKWNVDEAKKRIKATMEWRRDFKPDLIAPDEVRVESVTGKMSAYTCAI
jgi:hypothetical protein